MSTLDDRVERNVVKNVRENILSYVLSVIPDKITKHYKLEKLPMKRSKITEIIDSFIINEVEYRKFVSSFVQTNRYTNESIYVLSFKCPLSTQDVIIQPSKTKSKLKLKFKRFSNDFLQHIR